MKSVWYKQLRHGWMSLWIGSFFFVGVVTSEAWRAYTAIEPEPYEHVWILRSERVGDILRVQAPFQKLGCDKLLFVVLGYDKSLPRFLPYADMDGLPPEHDRTKGSQFLQLEIQLDALPVDLVEIRTRHKCGGKLVDRVFAILNPQINIYPPGGPAQRSLEGLIELSPIFSDG